MNTDLIKQTTFQDYQRRLNNVLDDVKELEKEPTGLYKRILNTDRQLLYCCMGKIVDVSQSSNINNRDELSFFESLNHLFQYYMYDDGELAIHWEHYIENFGFFECNKEDESARPCLSLTKFDEKRAKESDIHWLIDWYETEKENYRKSMIKFWGQDDEDLKCPNKKEFIDYDDPF
jgi:hypothetical protein